MGILMRVIASVLQVLFLMLISSPAATAQQGSGRLQIHFMNVGQGDGALLISPQGETVLFDSGVGGYCNRPIAYLRNLGIKSIDYHVASHFHSDHIGCASQVLTQFPLMKAAYDRGRSYNSESYDSYESTVRPKRRTVKAGEDALGLDQGRQRPCESSSSP